MSEVKILMHKKSGESWVPVVAEDFERGGTVKVSATAPLNPLPGQEWYDPETGASSIYDEDNGVWVVTSGPISDGIPIGIATVTQSTAASGSTISTTAQVDETVYLKSVSDSPVGIISFVLPSSANSRVGQVKMFVSSKPINSFVVSVSGLGTLEGAFLNTAFSNETYSFQCVSKDGAGTWLRVS